VSRFRGSEVSIDSVISVLKPGTLVRGSVSENGDRVRISFSVIDGNSGDDLGSRKGFEVPAGDLLAIRQIVSDSVATYLRDRVGKEVRARELEAGTTNREAFALVQRAEKLRRDAVSEVGRDSAAGWQKFTQADQLLAQAEGEDKKWANPIARRAVLALNEARAAKNALLSTPIVDRGVEHADRALKLDPNNPDALEARGRLRYERWNSQVDKDKAGTKLLEDARDDLVAVTKADPTRASALVALSTVYSQLHDAGQAYLAAQEAYNADAYLTGVESVLIQLFFTSYDREEFTQAVKWCRDEGFKRFPKDWRFTACQLLLRQAPGVVNTKIDSAWTEYQTLENVLPDGIKPFRTRQYRVFVAATIAKAGNRDSARHVLESVRAGKDIDPKGDLLTYEALVRPLLGTKADTAEAFKLVTDYVIGHPLHDFATTDHWWWRDLKKDPRWPKVGSGTSR
jgi:tetratricopeptide (TPR) repeat protein